MIDRRYQRVLVGAIIALFSLGILTNAQPSDTGMIADHKRLIDALDILAEDINRLTDRLFLLDTQRDELSANLHVERDTAAASFMAILRMSMGHRPPALLSPSTAINDARARAVLTNFAPERTLSEQQTLEALSAFRALEAERENTFNNLAATEARYDTLNTAIYKILANVPLHSPIEGQAEQTYLTEVDRILGLNLEEVVSIQAADDKIPRPASNLTEKPAELRTFKPQDGLIWPLQEPRIVTNFNDPQASIQFRQGVVIQTTQAFATIYAPFDGRVVFRNRLPGYGTIVIIEHAANVVSILSGHQTSQVVVGQWLLQGDPIGQLSSDRQQSANLYWQVRHGDNLVNPERWIN